MSAPVAPIRERTSPSKFQRWRAGPNSTPTAPLGPIPPTLALPTTAISDSPPLVLSVRFNPCPVTAKPGFECAPRIAMPYRAHFLPTPRWRTAASPGRPSDAACVLDVSCEEPPYRVEEISAPTYHCAAAVVTAPHMSTTVSKICMLSVHHEVDPAVSNVVIAFHEPVVAGIRGSHDSVLHCISNQVIVGFDQVRQRAKDVVRGSRATEVLRNEASRVVAGGEPSVATVHDIDQMLESIRIGFDLTCGIIILDHEHSDVLVGMCLVVLIELCLREEQHISRPIEIVLIERVWATRILALALIVVHGIARA